MTRPSNYWSRLVSRTFLKPETVFQTVHSSGKVTSPQGLSLFSTEENIQLSNTVPSVFTKTSDESLFSTVLHLQRDDRSISVQYHNLYDTNLFICGP